MGFFQAKRSTARFEREEEEEVLTALAANLPFNAALWTNCYRRLGWIADDDPLAIEANHRVP